MLRRLPGLIDRRTNPRERLQYGQTRPGGGPRLRRDIIHLPMEMGNIRRVALIVKPDDAEAVRLADTLTGYLLKRFDTVITENADGNPGTNVDRLLTAAKDEIGERCDFAITLGGDGTFLGTARAMAKYGVPLIGINLGRLGFLAEVPPENMIAQLDDIFDGACHMEERTMLGATYYRNGEISGEETGCNDFALKHRDSVRMIEVDTSIDGVFLNTVWSDGLIVSTPTGSTGYALSSGGPIIEPTLNALLLVPICPHTLSYRPLIVEPGKSIEIKYTLHNNDEGLTSMDGQVNKVLNPGDTVVLKTLPYRLKLIQPANHDYLRTLRTKLRWSERL